VILIAWAVFWVGWLAAAFTAKQPFGGGRRRLPGFGLGIVVVLLSRSFHKNTLVVRVPAVEILGAVIFVAGLSLAIWARVYIGRNWGMPMSTKQEPELVTSGPYRFVRHPIYSGLLLAIVGTALATNLWWLIAFVLLGAYFIYSATVEERILTESFPVQYPRYRSHTKMLIPFVL
jgi:protein-S-isoprenylcysteine O-methyltransferase Ste14